VDDETLIQYNPDPRNRYCHAVGGSRYNTMGGRLYGIARNANCVSLEICSTNAKGVITVPNDEAYSFTDKVLERAKEAVLYLMQLYSIDADHVIRHYDVNGKPCPGVIGWNKDSGSEAEWEAFHAAMARIRDRIFFILAHNISDFFGLGW
jgi:N-acetylmuramoyl-L-alanine amidase CwlA